MKGTCGHIELTHEQLALARELSLEINPANAIGSELATKAAGEIKWLWPTGSIIKCAYLGQTNDYVTKRVEKYARVPNNVVLDFETELAPILITGIQAEAKNYITQAVANTNVILARVLEDA